MPYLGLLPFLLTRVAVKLFDDCDCINALSRASPISTPEIKTYELTFEIVSMPYLELLPFLPSHICNNNCKHCIVSMPYLELLPFLPVMRKTKKETDFCINALSRASPISTVSFKKPCKIQHF